MTPNHMRKTALATRAEYAQADGDAFYTPPKGAMVTTKESRRMSQWLAEREGGRLPSVWGRRRQA